MLIGLIGAFSLLLGAAGLMKIIAPASAGHAVVLADMPAARTLSSPGLVRLFGSAELGVFALVTFFGGIPAAAGLGAAYFLLFLVAWRLFRYAPGRDCGCFGSVTAPAGYWHLGVNALACLVAAASLVRPAPSLLSSITSNGAYGALLLVGMVLLAYLGYLLMTALPALLALNAKVVTNR